MVFNRLKLSTIVDLENVRWSIQSATSEFLNPCEVCQDFATVGGLWLVETKKAISSNI